MLEPNDFYQILEEFYMSKQRVSPTFRLGTVDLAYTTGLPKVLLDGDETITIKQYSHLRNYTPTAGDRVILALVGNTYIILGRIRNDPLQSTDGGSGSTPVSVTWSDVTGKPSTFAPSAHSHPISDVTGLQTALDGKSSTSHTHDWASITGKPTTFTPSTHTHAWADITGKPTTFTPSTHSHAIADVTGLQTALDGKSATSHTHDWASITGKPTTFAPSAHTHTISQVTDFPTQATHSGKFLTTNGTSLSWATVSTGITEVDWVDVLNKPTAFPPTAHSHSWADITGKPTTFAPSAHSHAIADVTGLQTALDGKASSSHTHTISNVTDFPTQTGNTGKLLTTSGSALSWSDFTLTGMTTWHDVLGTPNAISLEAHYHPISDVTGLQTALDGKSAVGHTHDWASITSKPTTFTPSAHTHLWADITDKPSTFAPSTHSHAIADVTGLQGALDGKSATSHTHPDATTSVSGFMSGADKTKLNGIATGANNYSHPTGDGNLHVPATSTTNNLRVLKAGSTAGSIAWGNVAWGELTGVPSTFTPSTHSHAIADVTGLQTALDGKSSTSHTHAWADITGKPTTFTPSTHTHVIADITNFPSQATHSGKVLTTDGTNLSWVTPASGGGTIAWADITGKPATFPPDTHSHANATTSVAGFMSGADKTKLDGVATGANNYVHPTTDGNRHVPANGTTNNNKVLKATATAGTYSWGDVAWTEVTGKPSTFTPATHTHLWADITDKPSTFAPSTHSHAIADVTGLQSALDGKSSTSHSHAWSEITGKPWTESGFDITQSGGDYTLSKSTGSFWAYAYRPRVATDNLLIRSDAEVRAFQSGTTSYIPVRASSFPTGSSINYKTNLEDLRSVYNPIDMIKTLKPYKYFLITDLERHIYDKPKVGFISEMVDPIFRDEDGVDTYSIEAMHVGATQDLIGRVESLEKTVQEQQELISLLIDELNVLKGGDVK